MYYVILRKNKWGCICTWIKQAVGILKRTAQRHRKFLQQVVILQVLRGFEDIPTDSTFKLYTFFGGMPLPPLIHAVFRILSSIIRLGRFDGGVANENH